MFNLLGKKSNKDSSNCNMRTSSVDFSFFAHSKYSNLSDEDLSILSDLDKLKGSAPTKLAFIRKINLMDVENSIGKLEDVGLVEKDEKEAAELGGKWAFHSLTSEGSRVAHGLKHYK